MKNVFGLLAIALFSQSSFAAEVTIEERSQRLSWKYLGQTTSCIDLPHSVNEGGYTFVAHGKFEVESRHYLVEVKDRLIGATQESVVEGSNIEKTTVETLEIDGTRFTGGYRDTVLERCQRGLKAFLTKEKIK